MQNSPSTSPQTTPQQPLSIADKASLLAYKIQEGLSSIQEKAIPLLDELLEKNLLTQAQVALLKDTISQNPQSIPETVRQISQELLLAGNPQFNDARHALNSIAAVFIAVS